MASKKMNVLVYAGQLDSDKVRVDMFLMIYQAMAVLPNPFGIASTPSEDYSLQRTP
jgi:hypothetical protein